MKSYRYGIKTNIMGFHWYTIERRILGFIWIEDYKFSKKEEMLKIVEDLKQKGNICIKMN